MLRREYQQNTKLLLYFNYWNGIEDALRVIGLRMH